MLRYLTENRSEKLKQEQSCSAKIHNQLKWRISYYPVGLFLFFLKQQGLGDILTSGLNRAACQRNDKLTHFQDSLGAIRLWKPKVNACLKVYHLYNRGCIDRFLANTQVDCCCNHMWSSWWPCHPETKHNSKLSTRLPPVHPQSLIHSWVWQFYPSPLKVAIFSTPLSSQRCHKIQLEFVSLSRKTDFGGFVCLSPLFQMSSLLNQSRQKNTQELAPRSRRAGGESKPFDAHSVRFFFFPSADWHLVSIKG